MSRFLGVFVIVALLTMMLSFLFIGPGPGPQAATSAAAPADYDPMNTRPNEEGNSGELLYLRYCAGCHGVEGDGKGPAAPFLAPRPRDFTRGMYKFTSTPAGAPPLDEDLLRTITRGLHGTSMPSWQLLTLDARRSLVGHVKSFYKEWDPLLVQPPIPFHANPFDMTAPDEIRSAIEKGNTVYHKDATCWSCHRSYLGQSELEALLGRPARPQVEAAIVSPDQWGERILPPDFRTATLKSVSELRDLYRVITAGVGGTAMPSWANALPAEDLWALTLYVDSLRPDSAVMATLRELEEEDQ